MKTISIYLTLLTLICFISPKLSAQETNVKLYNELKFAAEREIIQGNYKDAIELYGMMIDSFFIWYNDLNNAFLAGLLSNDTLFLNKVVPVLLKGGRSAEKMEKRYSDYSYFKTESWRNLKDQPIDYFYNSEVRSLIKKMYVRDQEDRYNDSLRLRNDFENVILFNEIEQKYGFPSERDLGYTSYSDSLDYNQMLQNMLIHLARLFPWQTGELLVKQYLLGNIPTSNFIYLLGFTRSCDDQQLTCFSGPPASNALYVSEVLFSCSEKGMYRINANRKVFYLDAVEDQLEKVEFRKNSKLPWTMDDGFATYHYNKDKYTFEEFAKTLTDQGLEIYRRE